MPDRREQLERQVREGAAAQAAAEQKLRELLPLEFHKRWSELILRRLDTVAFLDGGSARRVIELEYELPNDYADDLKNRGVRYYPVALVDREVTVSLEVHNDFGARVPILSERESAERAGAMLVASAEESLGMDLPPTLAAKVRGLPAGKDVAARQSATSALLVSDEQSEDSAIRRELVAKPAFANLAWTLVRNQFIFVADRARRTGPRAILIECVVTLPRAAAQRSLRTRMLNLGELLGWIDTRLEFSAGDLGAAETTEVRFEAPEGVELSRAIAKVPTSRGVLAQYATTVDARNPRRFAKAVISDIAPGAPSGRFEVRLRPDPGYPAAVTATAIFAAVILTLGWFRLKSIGGQAALDPAVTILLAGPTVFAALIAQPGRGNPAARMLVAARFALVLAGLWTFVAGAILVGYPYGQTLRGLWGVLGILSWITAVILAGGLVGPLLRRLRRAQSQSG